MDRAVHGGEEARARRARGHQASTPPAIDAVVARARAHAAAGVPCDRRHERAARARRGALAAAGLGDLFPSARIICAADLPKGRGKPKPDIFLRAAALVGADPRAAWRTRTPRPGSRPRGARARPRSTAHRTTRATANAPTALRRARAAARRARVARRARPTPARMRPARDDDGHLLRRRRRLRQRARSGFVLEEFHVASDKLRGCGTEGWAEGAAPLGQASMRLLILAAAVACDARATAGRARGGDPVAPARGRGARGRRGRRGGRAW